MQNKEAARLFDEEFISRLEHLHLMARRISRGSSAGRDKSQSIGDGLQFADHRAYFAGDDIRFVDWHCYARMEKLLLRLFHRHSESDVGILLDKSGSMAVDDVFDYARKVTAALAYIATGDGSRVVLQPFDDSALEPVRSGRDRSKIFSLLDNLAAISPSGHTNLADAARDFNGRFPAAGWAILISDLGDSCDVLEQTVHRLADHKRLVVVVHTYSRATANPVLDGHLRLCHLETEQGMNITVTEQLRELYRQQWRKTISAIETIIARYKGIYIPALTDVPFESLIINTLRRAGVLG